MNLLELLAYLKRLQIRPFSTPDGHMYLRGNTALLPESRWEDLQRHEAALLDITLARGAIYEQNSDGVFKRVPLHKERA